MAHYAYLDENNIVTQVIVGRDENDLAPGITSWEEYYGAKRCSYNTRGGEHPDGSDAAFRKNYPGVGWSYDADRDAFIPPQPYASWTLNEDSCLWEAPVVMPDDGKLYAWDEEAGEWQEVVVEAA